MILLYFPQVYLQEAGTPGFIQGLIRRGGSGSDKILKERFYIGILIKWVEFSFLEGPATPGPISNSRGLIRRGGKKTG